MALTLRIWPDSSLRLVAQDVTVFDDSLRLLVSEMTALMYANQGAGLAATQVGDLRRVIVMDVTPERSNLQVFVNPVIKQTSKDHSLQEEGCLSFPGVSVTIPRPARVTGEALSPQGERFEFDLTGLASQCLQHEIEHLDGKVLTDHLNRAQRRRVEKIVSASSRVR